MIGSLRGERTVLLAASIYAGAIGLALARVGLPKEADGVRLSASWVMTDFYTAGYYPVRAVLDGENPHDRSRYLARYPVEDTYPPYLPTNLLLHLPFALLQPRSAALAYFVFLSLLTIPLAHATLRLAGIAASGTRVLLLAGAILLSRPGHWTLLLGQLAILLTLASYLALHLGKSAPVWSGFALALTMLKPTYGVPLALLMAAWGRWRAVAWGLGLAAVVNLPLVMLLAEREGGLYRFVGVLLTGYQDWQTLPDVNPATSNTRVDAASLLSRLLGSPLSSAEQLLLTVAILGASGLVLRLLARHEASGARDLAVGVICLAACLVGYHRGYDLVLLTAPFVMVAARGLPGADSPALRAVFLSLFSVPALNWLATESVISAWQPSRPVWLLVTSANSLCVAALLAAYLWLGARYHSRHAVGVTTTRHRPGGSPVLGQEG